MPDEDAQYLVDGSWVDLEGIQFGSGYPAAGVLGSLAEGDKTQEYLADRPATVFVEGVEGSLRTGRQRSDDTADLLVCREDELMLRPVLEQLGEGVLEQRQGAGLVGHVG